LRAYAQRDPLVEYKREAFDLFERLMATIDSEVVHRIFKVAVEHQHQVPVTVTPAVDLSQATEKHQEALEEDTLLEEVGQLVTETDRMMDQLKSEDHREEADGETKVTVERDGQIVAQETYGSSGNLQKTHGKIGRNDPCWCGSNKKYKRCHYPN